jgi:TonB family protein
VSSRVEIAMLGLVILLGVSDRAVGSQSSPALTLVDVPIPAYPPIAWSAALSGDVHVIVDVRPDGTVASASMARAAGFPRESDAKLFEQVVLEAARQARFRCDRCADAPATYSFVFAFRFAPNVGGTPGARRVCLAITLRAAAGQGRHPSLRGFVH